MKIQNFIKKALLVLTIIPGINNLRAQENSFNAEERSGLWFGFNVGFCFANKYNASFYNGSSNNENNINYILENPYYRNDIKNALGIPNGDFDLEELPERMKYDPSMMLGFYVAYRNNKNISFFAQFNYVKLKTADVFSIKVEQPVNILVLPDLHLYSIYGQEERTEIDLGITKYYDWGESLEGYLEGGLNLNSTNVILNKIMIENLEYSLINVYLNQNYVPNMQLTEYNIKQGGIGYGLFAGAGIKLFFNESLSLDPGFNLYYKMINLNGYKDFKFHYNIFIRFTFQDIFQ